MYTLDTIKDMIEYTKKNLIYDHYSDDFSDEVASSVIWLISKFNRIDLDSIDTEKLKEKGIINNPTILREITKQYDEVTKILHQLVVLDDVETMRFTAKVIYAVNIHFYLNTVVNREALGTYIIPDSELFKYIFPIIAELYRCYTIVGKNMYHEFLYVEPRYKDTVDKLVDKIDFVLFALDTEVAEVNYKGTTRDWKATDKYDISKMDQDEYKRFLKSAYNRSRRSKHKIVNDAIDYKKYPPKFKRYISSYASNYSLTLKSAAFFVGISVELFKSLAVIYKLQNPDAKYVVEQVNENHEPRIIRGRSK